MGRFYEGGGVVHGATSADRGRDQTTSPTAERTTPRLSRRERVIYAALVALIAFAAPVLLVWLVEPGFDWPAWWVAIGAAMVVPPFVFQLLSRSRPEWGYGLAFSLVPAMTFAVASGVLYRGDPEYSGGTAILIAVGVFAFVVTFLVGMVGASIASLVARPFNPENPLHRPQRLRAWHIGSVVAALDVAIVVAMAATAL